jgi:leucyl aminopeptidase
MVILLNDWKNLPVKYFRKEEIAYFKEQVRRNSKNSVIINRLTQVIGICFVKQELPADKVLEDARIAGHEMAKYLNDQRMAEIFLADAGGCSAETMAFAEGIAWSNYQFRKYKKNNDGRVHTLTYVYVHSTGIREADTDRLNILTEAVYWCRNMVNEPVSYLTASEFAHEIEQKLAEAGAKVEVFNKKKIEALRMGGLLAVNKGSVDPPSFTTIEWKPRHHLNKQPYVLVGKGIVFDSGGMNIKTGEYMNNMKSDMAGGAAVAAVLWAVAQAGLPFYLVGLVPSTDNRPAGNAFVNGDIIQMYNGIRVEVINTDAEGRLILADALSYAKKFNPSLVISLATLTGAAARAIGKYGMVGFSHSAESHFRRLQRSGDRVCERIVEFPMWEEYDELIKSEVADIKNLGGTDAGAITAAMFLKRFTDYPFIHLDIAGPAFVEKPYNYRGTGATGVGVRLLFDFFKQFAE